MNYFAHGMDFLSEPYFLAGTAVPDWLNVAHRKVRLRREQLLPWTDGSGSPADLFAAGILKHLEDDEWFHKTPGFERATGKMTRLFREHLKSFPGNPRSAFLGHITTELLLDAVLIGQNPGRLEDYYRALARIEPAWIAETVSLFAGQPVPWLSRVCKTFVESRFLFDYLEARSLLFRLNQVAARIKLRPLPESTTQVLADGRLIVERHLPDLLPIGRERFVDSPAPFLERKTP